MPNLTKDNQHKCPLCDYSTKRSDLKRHLTTAGKRGPRCPRLKKVIPSQVWTNEILPYYVTGAELGDLSTYVKAKKRRLGGSRCNYYNILTHQQCNHEAGKI